MTVGSTTNRFSKIKKIRGRSIGELFSRSGQAFAAYGETIGIGSKLPSDEEFKRLVDSSQFGRSPIIAESLWQKFYKNADERFFKSFVGDTAGAYRECVGEKTCKYFVEKAELIIAGRFDLLGYKNLYVGTEVDWHLEPVSGFRSPAKHWKEFDELDSSETGDKKIVWELNRHQHFFTLGVAYLLTGDERFAETFVRHLESWIEQNPPGIGINWSSSLEVSFRAMSWIWAFHFFRHSEAFTPEIFKMALKMLHLHGRHIEKYLSKYYSPNTHLTGEALGLYYLGTQMPFMLRAKHWRKLGQDILLDEVTRQFHSDGVYFEQSTWYQRYSVDFYTQFAILRSLSYDSFYDRRNALMDERLGRAFEFMMHLTRPDGTTPIIGDDDGGRLLPLTDARSGDFRGTLAAGAALFGRSDLKFVAGNRRDEVFWLLGADAAAGFDSLAAAEPAATSKNFAAGGYFAMRDGWTETDNFMVVDCGEVGAIAGGHGHADALSIDTAIHGRTLLVDPGTYSYHASREMRDLFRSTPAHNTITIDNRSSSEPGNIFNWRSRAEANQTACVTDARFDFFEGKVDGYSSLSGGATQTRSILFLKNDYWIIRDLVRTAGEHEHALNFHYAVDSKIATDIEGDFTGDDRHRIFSFGDGGSWHQNESWVSNEYGNKVNAPLLRFTIKGRGTQEFFTFLMPAETGHLKPEVFEMPITGGRAFVIKYRGYTDVFVAGDGETLRTELFDTNFRFSWARLALGESVPEEYVLVGGNRFAVDGHELFEGDEIHGSAAIRRFGSDLCVRSDGEFATLTLD
ncbi:MAG: alginate lyase family protein [Acidobacteria bacterium]|nr:alginate lyase family protein [Acidobacteriota bacterium]